MPRAVTSQKVMRTNDIENVGHDARHETFFEMLGNFSFADYFKAEAIAWAHELITEGYGIDHDLLWVTVYDHDDEAADRHGSTSSGCRPSASCAAGKLDDEGELANYWHTHAAGPAGPCSEIFVDRGPGYGPDGGPDVDEERFMEIWNLVFIQEQVDGDLEIVAPLPGKNVDTGSSLERVAMVLQGVDNVFETDLFSPTLEEAERLSGKRHGEDPQRRRVPQDRGRARPRHDVPDRRRGAALERGARLHPAPHVAPSRLPRSASRHRGQRARPDHHDRDRRVRRRLPGAAGERGVRAAGGRLRGRSVLRDPRQGPRAVRGGEGPRRGFAHLGRRRVRALRHVRHPVGSRSRSGRPRAASASTSTGFEELLEEQRDRARAARKKVEIGPRGGCGAADRVRRLRAIRRPSRPIALLLDDGLRRARGR